MTILEDMKTRVLCGDGGMGSLLQQAGLRPGELPETWNIRHPDVVVGIHRDYLRAGADIVTTNSFGANRLKYNPEAEYDLPEIVRAAVENAKQAVREEGHGYVALDIGPTGRLLKPMGQLDFEEAVSIFAEVVREGSKAGADLVLIETMSDSYELKAAVLAAKENCSLPVFATVIFDAAGKLLTGGTPESAAALLEGLGVDALGLNCGLGPAQMEPFARRLVEAASVPVIVNPNAGLPRSEGGKTVYDVGPEEFTEGMKRILDMGISVAGGCCGTTPAHIAKLSEEVKKRPAPVIVPKDRTVVTSYAHAVEIGRDPVLIGERINPTGKKRFKQALLEHDIEYILREGISQQEKGVHILDVNVGLPGIDEPAVMKEVVEELQAVTDLPLQIDTSDIRAMEAALRVYNGKALINSVSGKQAVMDAVFPLVAKYGGVVVGLTLDDDGIPGDADGRMAVAEKIYKEAAKYGISPKDILIDALCMTVSAEKYGALTTLETVRRVTEIGGKTILGVSNISFGLPHREIINAGFFMMAMQAGLSAAIVNPNSDGMMRSYHAFRALTALDENLDNYVRVYSNYVPPVPKGYAPAEEKAAQGQSAAAASPGGSMTPADKLSGGNPKEPGNALQKCVEKGLKDQAVRECRELLKTEDPLDVINQTMIPALDYVGKAFEKGTLFLPQLLMSAEAARAAFEVIKERLSGTGMSRTKNGKVILATVKGDIHDIGKNIVKVLLENYSFEVIDLGKDVEPEKVVEAALKENVSLVGLSALMTTTVPAMEETIKLLRDHAPGVKVMVGGAVLTEDYAKSIGADRYCRDGMASVNYAREVLGSPDD